MQVRHFVSAINLCSTAPQISVRRTPRSNYPHRPDFPVVFICPQGLPEQALPPRGT